MGTVLDSKQQFPAKAEVTFHCWQCRLAALNKCADNSAELQISKIFILHFYTIYEAKRLYILSTISCRRTICLPLSQVRVQASKELTSLFIS